jgi:hypothetical protein
MTLDIFSIAFLFRVLLYMVFLQRGRETGIGERQKNLHLRKLSPKDLVFFQNDTHDDENTAREPLLKKRQGQEVYFPRIPRFADVLRQL